MTIVKPTKGQLNWDIPLNTALDNLDSRLTVVESWVTAPAHPTSSGSKGQCAYDANYVYFCVATNTWVRVARANGWT